MAEDIKADIRRFYEEVVEKGNLDVIDELCTPDFVEHEQVPGVEGEGTEVVRQFFTIWRNAFPDTRVEVHHILVDGDMAAVHCTFAATHTGDWMGMPPTGKQFRMPLFDLLRFEGGKAAEHWGVADVAGMMQQLGAMPAPAGVSL